MDDHLAIPAQTRLYDVLQRAQSLEHQSTFVISLPVQNILDRTRSVMSPSAAADDRARSDADERRRQGQVMLAKKNRRGMIERETAREALKKLKLTEAREEKVALSFDELSTICRQVSIVNSVLGAQADTEELNDKFIADALWARRVENQAQLQREVAKTEATLSVLGFASGEGVPDRRILSMQSKFFAEMLAKPQDTYAKHLAKGLRKRQGLFSSELQRSLADCFKIVACLQKEKDRTWKGSLTFLESQMKRFIRSEVDANLRNAKLQRDRECFGFLLNVEGYLRLQSGADEFSMWGVIYYALRCGMKEEATRYAKENNFDGDLVSALYMFSQDMPVSGSSRDSLVMYMRQEMAAFQRDIKKVLVLMLLTNEIMLLDDLEAISSTVAIEDWLWLRLHIDHNLNAIAQEMELMKARNPRLLEDQANPFKREHLLLLTGKFNEAAQAFLQRENNLNEGLQVILAMHVAGMVEASVLKRDLLLFACDIFRADPVCALRFVNKITNKEDRIQALAELAVEVPNGYLITQPINTTTQAPLATVVDPSEQKLVIRRAGEEAERRDQHEKAASFFKLLYEYDHVIELECEKLVQCIEDFRTLEEAEKFIKTATELCEEIQVNGKEVLPERYAEMRALIQIAMANVLSRQGRYDQAAMQIEETGLLPVRSDQVLEKRGRISRAQPYLWRAIPSALLITLKAYSKIYERLAPSSDIDAIRLKSDAIIQFTGYLDFIPEDVQKQLLDYDGLISVVTPNIQQARYGGR